MTQNKHILRSRSHKSISQSSLPPQTNSMQVPPLYKNTHTPPETPIPVHPSKGPPSFGRVIGRLVPNESVRSLCLWREVEEPTTLWVHAHAYMPERVYFRYFAIVKYVSVHSLGCKCTYVCVCVYVCLVCGGIFLITADSVCQVISMFGIMRIEF